MRSRPPEFPPFERLPDGFENVTGQDEYDPDRHPDFDTLPRYHFQSHHAT